MSEKTYIRAEANRCLLCHEAACTRACPSGVEPDKIIRSLYFDNYQGARKQLGLDNPCKSCDEPCTKACIRSNVDAEQRARMNHSNRRGELPEDYDSYESIIPTRLSKLRNVKGISARDMSLSIGQNPSYINNIENGKSLPSMVAFFCICDFLDVTPIEFFDIDNDNPELNDNITDKIKKLTDEQRESIIKLIDMIK